MSASAAPRGIQRVHHIEHLLMQLEVADGKQTVAAPLASHIRTAEGVRTSENETE
jgi:hypothetical protein